MINKKNAAEGDKGLYLGVKAEFAGEGLSVIGCDRDILARLDVVHIGRKLDSVALMPS